MTKLEAYLEKANESKDKAHREVCDLASGKRKWEMCVPIQNTDSDIVLQAPLDILETLISIIRKQAEAIEEIAEMRQYKGFPQHATVAESCQAEIEEILK